MQTYLLVGSRAKLNKLSGEPSCEGAVVYRDRAVIAFSNGFEPPADLIVEKVKGNQVDKHRAWACRSILDELQAEYLQRKAPTPKQKAEVERGYIKAKRAREKAAKALEQAEATVQEAARELVRTYGRGPIVIEGETLDSSFRGETVYFIRRKGL